MSSYKTRGLPTNQDHVQEYLFKLYRLNPGRGQWPHWFNALDYDVSGLSSDEIVMRNGFNNLAATYGKSYLPDCVVKDKKRGWVELRCPLCGRNGQHGSSKEKTYFKGRPGFRRHVVEDHKEVMGDMSKVDEPDYFVHRTVDAEEVSRLRRYLYSSDYSTWLSQRFRHGVR